MIGLSPRFAVAAGALLLCAALPVLLHAGLRPVRDDCRDPDAFFGAPRIAGAEVSRVVTEDGAASGVEGELERVPLQVKVLRTFEPFRFYARPLEYGFRTHLYVDAARTRYVEAGDDRLALHWRTNAWSDLIEFEGYGLAQGGRPVWHPIESGLALAGSQLLSGTQPVTLFIVSGGDRREDLAQVTREADAWLAQAWHELEAACEP